MYFFSYIPPQNSVYFNLHRSFFFESVETGIRKYSDLGEILWMGELNARCGNFLFSFQGQPLWVGISTVCIYMQ